jgi:hypothetical protein
MKISDADSIESPTPFQAAKAMERISTRAEQRSWVWNTIRANFAARSKNDFRNRQGANRQGANRLVRAVHSSPTLLSSTRAQVKANMTRHMKKYQAFSLLTHRTYKFQAPLRNLFNLGKNDCKCQIT